MPPWLSQLSAGVSQPPTLTLPPSTGGIPAAWAANGSFTALRSASLGGQQLGGTLPPEWGGGLPALEQLELSNAELQGTLPPQWGAGLPRLQEM